MGEFEDLQARLGTAGAEQGEARSAQFRARQELARVRRDQEALARAFQPNDPGLERRRHALDARESELRDRLARHDTAAERSKGTWQEAIAQFGAFTEPRENLGRLSDAYPLLLLPLRLETRFGLVREGEATTRELWVRVFPDDCWVDTFEPTLTDGEIANARAYWAARWRSAGDEAEERAAWRTLVTAHGAGRAAWIVETYRPVNLADRPTSRADGEVLLVIVTTDPLEGTADTEVTLYWTARWRAGSDAGQAQAAYADLEAEVGAAEAARIVSLYRPGNLDAPPPKGTTRASATVRVLTVVLPPSPVTKDQAWSHPPKVTALPERLVLLCYRGGELDATTVGNTIPDPLIVGPDPGAPEAEQIHIENGELIVPDDMRWLTDFDRAIEVGMGFRLPLSEAQATDGFERILVAGVRLAADADAGRRLVEDLLRHHQHGRSGFAVLPQGRPTNNTEGQAAGYRRVDDADATFALVHKDAPAFVETADWLEKADGQWLAEWLGLDPETLTDVANADATDQREARAMQVALWPATLGYYFDSLLAVRGNGDTPPGGIVGRDAADALRWFFTRYVIGRGVVPTVRVGAQPYSILPTTAWSRMSWPTERVRERMKRPEQILPHLRTVLERMRQDWTGMAGTAVHVGGPGDAHQQLLGVLGLEASSVEFYQRFAETADQQHSVLAFFSAELQRRHREKLDAAVQSARALLQELGYAWEGDPELLKHPFFGRANRLSGPVVDDRPLSETDRIHATTTDGRNYIQWLHDAAGTSLDALRTQAGFPPGESPRALLYLLLKYALERGYDRTGRRLLSAASELGQLTYDASRLEPAFVHVQDGEQSGSESRWYDLYRPAVAVTDSDDQFLHAYITENLTELADGADLQAQVDALSRLDVPTARLERAFAEHIDCCSYRLDAWMLGFVHYQLDVMRFRGEADGDGAQKGVYLGAYGWLEDIRPRATGPEPVALQGELAASFPDVPGRPLVRDPANGGYILAPSLNHAVTAAVLRNGYLSSATRAAPQALAVNLSSERVRVALELLEGMRNGQSLGALLGYRLERGLHDRHAQPQLHTAIYALRAAFPLRANRITTTATPPGTPAEAIDARNVVDGVRLLEQVRRSGQTTWPYGTSLPGLGAGLREAVDDEIAQLLDSHDALADLALAESVHQSVQGNHERAAATLDAFSKATLPPIPDVVQTPRSGVHLHHRVVIHLNPNATAPAGATPRARAEPAMNAWLASILPAPNRVGCRVRAVDPATGATVARTVTQGELGLEPIDLLYLLDLDTDQSMAELDDRVVDHFLADTGLRPDARPRIEHTMAVPGIDTFFQLNPMVRSLRSLLVDGRPLAPRDLVIGTEDRDAEPGSVGLDRTRLAGRLGELQAIRAALESFLLHIDQDATAGIELDTLDQRAGELLAVCRAAADFGLLRAGRGQVIEGRRALYAGLVELAGGVAARHAQRLRDFDDAMDAYDDLDPATPGDARIAHLVAAERLVSTRATFPITTLPALLASVVGKRGTLEARRAPFAAISSSTAATVTALRAEVEAAIAAAPPLADVDPEAVSLNDHEAAARSFVDDLARQAQAMVDELDERLSEGTARLAEADAATDPTARVAGLQATAAALFGGGFRVIPTVILDGDAAGEFANAWAAGPDLTKYLRQDVGVDEPIEDWLAGLARVRPKLHHLENARLMAEPLHRRAATPAADLQGLEPRPLQLPYRADASWLALQFPADEPFVRDHLLYTGTYVTTPNPSKLCGVVVDEWPEVVPVPEQTVGLTFHFDRPNAEPPQAWLLVTPARWDGAWSWDDLVGALHDTLELARLRAVEPDLIEDTDYAPLLPASVFPVYAYQISIMANLAISNGVYREFERR